MSARVLLGLAPLDEQAVEERLYGRAELHVLASAADAGELVALAATVSPELVLVSAGLPGLNGRTVAELRALRTRLAGLALDERAASALAALGLELLVRSPDELWSALAPSTERRPPAELEPRESWSPPLRAPLARGGSVIAFLGSKGAPGASELAASFAALVGRRHRVLLAELDGEGSALAARLGVDPQAGSLLGLARALAAGEPDPQLLLPHWIVAAERGWPAVLPGLPDPHGDLLEVFAPGLAEAALALLAASFPLVVCDLGHRLLPCGERDLAARLHREAALAADALVLVVGARPEQRQAGLAQLDLLLGELRAAPEALRVVLNGQPGLAGSGRGDAAALSAELGARGIALDGSLPFDERALRASARRGLPFAAASRRGPYARRLAELAAAILLPSLPRPAARKRRLPALPARTPERAALPAEEVALPWKQ